MKSNANLLVLTLLLPTFALAQSREGSCHSPICYLTAAVVVLLLVAAFLLTLVESVLKHGFLAGIIKHKGVQVLSLYVLGIGTIIALTFAAEALFGKNGAVGFPLVAMVAIYVFWHRYEGSRKSSDTDAADDN